MGLLTEHDLKHIILIEKKLFLFEERKIDLFKIICDLNSLLHMLEFVSESWKDDFQAEINILEIIYDSIEDGSISRWEGNYKEDLYNTTSKLKKMTASILEEYLGKSDLNISESAIKGDSNWLICPKCNDGWETDSMKAMVLCPKCDCPFHNPRVSDADK
jgi:hypothetical protein